VGNLVRPDHTIRTGQLAEAASRALFHIESSTLSFLMQSGAKAGQGAICILAMMTEYGNRGSISDKMHIDMPAACMNSLAGYLAGTAANASTDVNINRHLIPPGILA